MLHLKRFKEYIKLFADFSEDEWNYYGQYIELVEFDRKEFLIEIGQVENHIYFILDGVTRAFFQHNNQEICIDFGFQNNFFCSYPSFISRQPSEINIQAISSVLALRVNYDHLQRFYEGSKKIAHIAQVLAERLYIRKLKRERQLLSLSAEEKYKSLINEYPTIIQKIAIKDIASYLGIHPDSLSRIRKNVRF